MWGMVNPVHFPVLIMLIKPYQGLGMVGSPPGSVSMKMSIFWFAGSDVSPFLLQESKSRVIKIIACFFHSLFFIPNR